MARTVLIDDKTSTVVNVIEAESDFVADEGQTAVQSDTAQIGDTYSGGVFTSPWVVASQQELLKVHASRQQERVMSGGISVDVGGGLMVEVSTDTKSQTAMHSAAWQAQSDTDASKTFTWVQGDGTSVDLSSAQILTINDEVSSFVQKTFDTLASVIAAIDDGTITTDEEVDNPPSGVLPWPPNS